MKGGEIEQNSVEGSEWVSLGIDGHVKVIE